MTAAEALTPAHAYTVTRIARDAKSDRRAVANCLAGKSPASVIRDRIVTAATALGVTDIPPPKERPRRPSPHAALLAITAERDRLACENGDLRAEVARLRAELESRAPVAGPVPGESPPVSAESSGILAIPARAPKSFLQASRAKAEPARRLHILMPDGEEATG